MNDELAEKLLTELVETRKSFTTATESFNTATAQIKWNRINTVIQYVLIAVVAIMLGLGVTYYMDEKQAACERGNDLRVQIALSLDFNATAIGAALAVVSGASPETFDDYMDVYENQEKPPILELREC